MGLRSLRGTALVVFLASGATAEAASEVVSLSKTEPVVFPSYESYKGIDGYAAAPQVTTRWGKRTSTTFST